MFGCLPIEFNYMVSTDTYLSGAIYGTRFTAGANNTKSNWVQLISGSKLEKDCYLLHMFPIGNSTSFSSSNQMLLDIGIDRNGGTTYEVIIKNFPLQNVTLSNVKNFRLLEIPIFIKSGTSVAVRLQSAVTTPTTNAISINSIFYGQPSRPEIVPRGLVFDIIGNITESTTTAVVIPDGFREGTGGYKGTYQLIGTANRDYWAVIPSVINTSSAMGAMHINIDIGVGPDQTKVTRIMHDLIVQGTTLEEILMDRTPILCRIKSGDNLYVRGKSGSTITSSTLQIALLGIS